MPMDGAWTITMVGRRKSQSANLFFRSGPTDRHPELIRVAKPPLHATTIVEESVSDLTLHP